MFVLRVVAARRGAHSGIPFARRPGHPAGWRHDGRQPSVPLLRLPPCQGACIVVEPRFAASMELPCTLLCSVHSQHPCSVMLQSGRSCRSKPLRCVQFFVRCMSRVNLWPWVIIERVLVANGPSIVLQLIVKSDTFIHAVQKMQRALDEFQIRGVKTNISFLEKVMRHDEFLSGSATTSFIDRRAAAAALDPGF